MYLCCFLRCSARKSEHRQSAAQGGAVTAVRPNPQAAKPAAFPPQTRPRRGQHSGRRNPSQGVPPLTYALFDITLRKRLSQTRSAHGSESQSTESSAQSRDRSRHASPRFQTVTPSRAGRAGPAGRRAMKSLNFHPAERAEQSPPAWAGRPHRSTVIGPRRRIPGGRRARRRARLPPRGRMHAHDFSREFWQNDVSQDVSPLTYIFLSASWSHTGPPGTRACGPRALPQGRAACAPTTILRDSDQTT